MRAAVSCSCVLAWDFALAACRACAAMCWHGNCVSGRVLQAVLQLPDLSPHESDLSLCHAAAVVVQEEQGVQESGTHPSCRWAQQTVAHTLCQPRALYHLLVHQASAPWAQHLDESSRAHTMVART